MINKTTLEKYIETLNGIYAEFSTTRKVKTIIYGGAEHLKLKWEDAKGNSGNITWIKHYEEASQTELIMTLCWEVVKLVENELHVFTSELDRDSLEDRDTFIDNTEWLSGAVENSNELIKNWWK